MSAVIASSPVRTPAVRDHDTDHTERSRRPERTWIWRLVEALAYAGASIDPASALAAQRFARLRDEELGDGRW